MNKELGQEGLQEQRNEQIKPWQFKKGQSGNPKGRPPGKSLKERTKAMLNAMTEEEEQEFLAGMDKRTIWEMAEGKAKQETEHSGNLTISQVLDQLENGQETSEQNVEDKQPV